MENRTESAMRNEVTKPILRSKNTSGAGGSTYRSDELPNCSR
jgi:hypothetical protein